jgi:HD-GYP domain-containing protein (c-di-GMP phosphodiesterase class II)
VAVADAFDAMTSNRPYHADRKGKPAAAAFAEVEKQSGRQFDPRCAAAFLEMRDQVVRTMVELMPGTDLGTDLGPIAPVVVPPGAATVRIPDPRD